MGNVMTGFMQGYNFVDRKKRLDRHEKRLDTDRANALTRQTKQDERADELWGRQTKAMDEQDEIRGLQAQDYNIDTLLEGVRGGDQTAIARAQELAAGDARIQGFNQRMQDPQAVEQTAQDIDILEAGFRGGPGTKQERLDAANRVLGPWLNQGDGGENKRIVDILPSKSGKGFYVELEMEENGETKRAPLTGPNRSAEDTEVKEIPADQLAQALMLLKQEVNTRRVALGDNAPVQARAAAQQMEFQGRAAIERMKQEIAGTGIDTKEFRQHLSDLHSLYKTRINILKGSDEFGNVFPQENIDAALADINPRINDMERYIQTTAPELWQRYRPDQQGPAPGPEEVDDLERILLGGAGGGQEQASPAEDLATIQVPGAPVVGGGRGAFASPAAAQQAAAQAPTRLTRQPQESKGSLREVQGQINQNFNKDNPISKTFGNIGEFIARGATQINAALTNLARIFVVDPVTAAASDIAVPFKQFQAWSRNRYPVLSAEALAAFAEEDPEAAEMIVTAIAQ